jgi:hypothetical protein
VYAPPEDRNHPLLAELARMGAGRAEPVRTAFANELAVARSDASRFLPDRQRPAAAGLARATRLREIALG